MKLELIPIPVTDVDRAKRFYVEDVGFTEDVDVEPTSGLRVVQLTPRGSSCSIGIGYGAPMYDSLQPGSVKNVHLVVDDLDVARDELLARGVGVSDGMDVGGGVRYASFSDPAAPY